MGPFDPPREAFQPLSPRNKMAKREWDRFKDRRSLTSILSSRLCHSCYIIHWQSLTKLMHFCRSHRVFECFGYKDPAGPAKCAGMDHRWLRHAAGAGGCLVFKTRIAWLCCPIGPPQVSCQRKHLVWKSLWNLWRQWGEYITWRFERLHKATININALRTWACGGYE